MDIWDFLDKFSSKQRLAAIFIICAAAVGAAYYFSAPRVAVAPADVGNGAALPSQPVMPKGYQPAAVMRDPFAVPPEYQKKAQAVPSPAVPPAVSLGKGGSAAPVPGKKPAEPIPVLNGIVGGGNTKVAIIQYGSESRSYKVKEYVGPYQLLAIYEESVMLWGPGGKFVLTLGG